MTTTPGPSNKSAYASDVRVQDASRQSNGASKAKRVKLPVPPAAPPRPYIPPPLPLSEASMQMVYQEVMNGSMESRDASFGEALAQMLGGPLPSGKARQYHFREAAIEGFLRERGLRKQPLLTREFPSMYNLGSQTHTYWRRPAVFLKDTNAPFIEKISIANHGFAYMPPQVCDAVCECNEFHLFVLRPSPPGVINRFPWRYCGRFVAHKTPYRLSHDGWERLSEDKKRVAAEMRCVYRHGGDMSSATAEAIRRYQQQFSIGAVGMPLVLLHKHAVAIERRTRKAIPERAVVERREAAEAEAEDKTR